MPYFVLISTIIFLIAVKNDYRNTEIRRKLLQGIADLEEMAKWHGFTIRAIGAVRYLASCWGVDDINDNASSRDLTELLRPSSVIPDSICPDASILEMLQRIQPILSSNTPSLFSPFPMDRLSQDVLGLRLEKEGFTIALRDLIQGIQGS